MVNKTKARISANDLYRIHTMAGPELSPDGENALFTVGHVDKKTERKYSNLWIVPARGGRERQFTYGDQVDTQPKWSPNGRLIAFLSNRGKSDQPQIHIIPAYGGEAYSLSDLKGKFGSFNWSPDGNYLAVEFQKKDPDAIERDKDEQKKRLGIVSRHITRINYKRDGVGFLPKERWHIWTIDTRNGKAKQLTDSTIHDEREPAWAPDGQSIVFVSNQSDDPDFNPHSVDLWAVPSRGGAIKKVPTPYGPKSVPSVSPDGHWVAYIGNEGKGAFWKNDNLWIVPIDGNGDGRDLTGHYDIMVSNSTINDLNGKESIPPTWSNDGKSLYFQLSRHGNTTLHSISSDGGAISNVIDRPGVVGTYSIDHANNSIAYFHSDFKNIGQVWMLNLKNGQSRRLTRVNQNLLNSVDLGDIEEIWFKGYPGNDLQGWILKPPSFDPQKKYPSILEIHGGPAGQYGDSFIHEFYFLAAHGYVVFFANPRGGSGYGEEHAKVIDNAAGTADYDDVMAWTDIVASQPYIDETRIGVTGGSYGGFMTNWIIGHTHRFKAAVTLRSIVNRLSSYGTSDNNWMREETFDDEQPWVNPDNYLAQSPLKAIGNAKTPTLIIHSENDMRCPIEQGEQVFTALKRIGVETEMVRFPEESHGLSRSGRTDRRVARLNYILDWFDRYL